MGLKPRLKKKNYISKKFYGRDYYLEKVDDLYNSIELKDFSVLMYYGIGGIGKSSLINSIKSRYENYESNIIAYVNFEESNNILDFYTKLSQDIGSKVDLFYFNIAFSIYWSKVNPNISLKESNFDFLDEGTFLSDSLAMVDGLSAFGLGGGVLSLAVKYSKKVNRHFKNNYQEELEEFESLSVNEMEEALPKFFSYDIKIYLSKRKESKFLFLLDTHEIIWEKLKQESKILESDVWLRDLILFLEKSNSLFIIAGREKLRWVEEDEEWDEILNQYKLTEFEYKESVEYLKSSGIKENDIIDLIATSSEGIPFYLNLSLDTYYNIEKPTLNHFIDNKKNLTSIFNRFLTYSNQSEIATLKVLSVTEHFDFELFSSLVKEFNTGLPSTEFSYLTRYSFISTKDNKSFSIHNLMKQSIVNLLDKEILCRVHSYLYKIFNDQVSVNIENNLFDSNTLKLYFSTLYHYSFISSEKEHLDYFNQIIIHFYKSDKYKYIIYAYNKQLEYLRELENILKVKILISECYLQISDIKKLSKEIEDLKQYDLPEDIHNNLSMIIALKQQIMFPNKPPNKPIEMFKKMINFNKYNNNLDLLTIKIKRLALLNKFNHDNVKLKHRTLLNSLYDISETIENFKLPENIDNLDSLNVINNFIEYYIEIGQYNSKLNDITRTCFGGLEDYLKKALNLIKKYYGADNLYTAKIYEIYAEENFNNKIENVEKFYYQTLKIYNNILGINSSYSQSIYKKIALILYKKGSYTIENIDVNILFFMLSISMTKEDVTTFNYISNYLEKKFDGNDYELSNIIKLKIWIMITNNIINIDSEVKKLIKLTSDDEFLHKSSYSFLGKSYLRINQFNEASIYLKKERDLLIKFNKFDDEYFDNFNKLFQTISKEEGIELITQTELHLENNYKLLIKIYQYLIKYYSSIENKKIYFYKAIELGKKHKNKNLLSDLYLNQASIDSKNEIQHLIDNKNLFKETTNYIKLDRAYGYLIEYYKKIEKKEQIEKYLLVQLNLRENYINNDIKLYKGYFFLYLFYKYNKDIKNQFFYLKKCNDTGYLKKSTKALEGLLNHCFEDINYIESSLLPNKKEWLEKFYEILDVNINKDFTNKTSIRNLDKICKKLIALNNKNHSYKKSIFYYNRKTLLLNKLQNQKRLKAHYISLNILLNDIYNYSKGTDVNLYFECLNLLDVSIINHDNLQILYKKSITNFRIEERYDLREIMQKKLHELLSNCKKD
jgi:hypothetical protein